jgi:hypothetical protein
MKPIYSTAVRLILDNFGIVGRIPVDSSHLSLYFDDIYFEGFKAILIPAYRPTGD